MCRFKVKFKYVAEVMGEVDGETVLSSYTQACSAIRELVRDHCYEIKLYRELYDCTPIVQEMEVSVAL